MANATKVAANTSAGIRVGRVNPSPPSDSDWQEMVDQRNEALWDEAEEISRDHDAAMERDDNEHLAYSMGIADPALLDEIVKKHNIFTDTRDQAMELKKLYPGATVAVRPLEAEGDYLLRAVLRTKVAGTNADWMEGTCFIELCSELGLKCSDGDTSPSHLERSEQERARTMTKQFVRLDRRLGRLAHPDNHVTLVKATNAFSVVTTGRDPERAGEPLETRVLPVQSLFDPNQVWYYTNYYSGTASQAEPVGSGQVFGDLTRGGKPTGAAESVVHEDVRGGGSNVSGGVVRRVRRKVNPTPTPAYAVPGVARNYTVAAGIMFNNVDEMVLDAISADYAQEILEEVFGLWGLPFDNPAVMKYAEDLVFTFLVATTASDKADYNRSYDLPSAPGMPELLGDFKVLSDTVVVGHRLTRRQFARGLADRLRKFVRADENASLQATLADRAGCQMQYGDLCFDGSTHCKGLTSSEKAFTRTLEARNLFESDAVLANGASDRLLAGFNQRQTAR